MLRTFIRSHVEEVPGEMNIAGSCVSGGAGGLLVAGGAEDFVDRAFSGRAGVSGEMVLEAVGREFV